jgi:hypothetical protein
MGMHNKYKVPRRPRDDNDGVDDREYVFNYAWQNSQILRRPQDDIEFCGSFVNIG